MLRRKLVMLGEMAVGKTSIMRRLSLGRFDGNYKGTIGLDIYVHKLDGLGPAHDQEMELVICDTDGNLGTVVFEHDAALRGAAAAMIVGDVSRPRTFGSMVALARKCDEYLPGRHVHFLFNKIDLLGDNPDVALPTEIAAFCHPVIMTSALTGDNVKEAFSDAANAIIRRGL